jgi:hypothetical protein
MDPGPKSLENLDPRERTRERHLQKRPISTPVLLRPERGRLARMTASEEPLSLTDHRQAIRDMHSLITRDFTVLYLPGHEPAEDAYSVAYCRRDLQW